ncbi:hypothetical protein G6L37_06655 [Agrobacterium rubi]|nr:hypothetical protein [Agrobacterium rubi]NTF25044.1 hypothetical protein [Agrobacterium rubi]
MTTIEDGMICPVFEEFSINDDGSATLVDIDGFERRIPASAMVGGGRDWTWGSLVTLDDTSREMVAIRKSPNEIRQKLADMTAVSKE